MSRAISERDTIIKQKLEQVLDKFSQDKSEDDCIYLVDLEIKHAHGEDIISIYVDTDQGIDIDQCKAISRFVSEALETDREFDAYLHHKYRLDVSSPGLARPLKLERQYKKNLNRLLQVKYKTQDGQYKVADGILTSLDSEDSHIRSLTLNITKIDKSKPNVKPKAPEYVTIAFSQIVETKVKVSF